MTYDLCMKTIHPIHPTPRTLPPSRKPPSSTPCYYQSNPSPPPSPQSQAPFLNAVADGLKEVGVPVLQMHAESAPGQFEVVLGHLPALEGEGERGMT